MEIGLGTALLFIFLVMPLLVAALVVWFVQSRSEPFPAERTTSYLLANGTPAEATILDWRSPAQSFLDRHPMVTFRVQLESGGGADGAVDTAAGVDQIDITQSIPRTLLRQLAKGDVVRVRLSDDRLAAAIDFGD